MTPRRNIDPQRLADCAELLTEAQALEAAARGHATRWARLVFKKRGNHSEAHLGETELAGILAAALESFEGPGHCEVCGTPMAERVAVGHPGRLEWICSPDCLGG